MEQLEISSAPHLDTKTIEIKEGDIIYKCKIEIIKNFIQVLLYKDNI